MNSKQVFGIVILIAGVIMLGASFYIKNQVLQGRMQISEAQGKVDTANSIFSLTPQTQSAGKVFTGSAQSQINAGSSQADYYAQMANWLQIGGIILIIAGGAVFIFCRRK